jgi:hypothetical protein
MIMMEFKDRLLNMKFDSILSFMSELPQQEIFSNFVYFAIQQGTIDISEGEKDFNFVHNFGKNLKKIYVTSQLMELLEIDCKVFHVK